MDTILSDIDHSHPPGQPFCSGRALMFPSCILLVSLCLLTWKTFVPSSDSCHWLSGILLSKKPSWPALLCRTCHHGDLHTCPSLFIAFWQFPRGFLLWMYPEPSIKPLSMVEPLCFSFFLGGVCLSIVSSGKGWAHRKYSVKSCEVNEPYEALSALPLDPGSCLRK